MSVACPWKTSLRALKADVQVFQCRKILFSSFDFFPQPLKNVKKKKKNFFFFHIFLSSWAIQTQAGFGQDHVLLTSPLNTQCLYDI
jgi:hypothetical protein